jgi:hypothetical protein
MTRLILFTLAILAAMASPVRSHADGAAVVYLVRHAEKTDDGRDPELSATGRERASELARMLRDAGISHICNDPDSFELARCPAH